MKSSKQQNSPQSKAEALAFIPFHNEIARWHVTDDELVMIEYPLPIKPFLRSILQRFSKNPIENPTKKLELDSMGSAVWQMIDGKKTTKEIILLFASSYSVSRQESEMSVTTFLQQLGRRGLVGMMSED